VMPRLPPSAPPPSPLPMPRALPPTRARSNWGSGY